MGVNSIAVMQKAIRWLNCLPNPSMSPSSSPKETLINRIVRVDHAGELAADRIYAGQMFVLGNSSTGPMISKMWKEEKNHLDEMERLSATHNVSPSLFSPIFSIAGFVLGMGSAAVGKEAAMGCTVAVEELIGTHYNDQVKELLQVAPEEEKLLQTLTTMRDDELEHYELGKSNDGEKSPFFNPFKVIVQTGCKAAIAVAAKI